WEQTVLPTRLPGYQRRMLDECLAGGGWTWACEGDDAEGPGLLAFWSREQLKQAAPPAESAAPLSPVAAAGLASLRQRGASFVSDLASDTGLSPRQTRRGSWELVRRGLATNDSFEVVRHGEPTRDQKDEPAPSRNGREIARRSYRPITRRRPLHYT